MKLPWQQATWADSIKANIALSIAVVVLAVTAAAAVMHSMSIRDRIVLTPMTIDRTMVVEWGSADEEYLKAFSLSVGQLVGNITPQNANFVVNALSGFLDSSIYSEVRKKIIALSISRQFKESASATRFLPNVVESEEGKYFVGGNMELTAATGKQLTPLTFEFKIKIKDGRPVIYSFDNYQDVPHMKEWLMHHANDVKTDAEDGATDAGTANGGK